MDMAKLYTNLNINLHCIWFLFRISHLGSFAFHIWAVTFVLWYIV